MFHVDIIGHIEFLFTLCCVQFFAWWAV